MFLAPRIGARYGDRVWIVAALLACTPAPVAADASDVSEEVPRLTAVDVTCDAQAAEWTFTATTSAWTGNGDVRLSADGAYVESHALLSVSAAEDGSADELRLSLSIVADWRDVVSGSRTAFNCEAPDLAGVLRVRTRDGAAVADCRAFGVAPERWTEWDADVACDTVLEPADSGG